MKLRDLREVENYPMNWMDLNKLPIIHYQGSSAILIEVKDFNYKFLVLEQRRAVVVDLCKPNDKIVADEFDNLRHFLYKSLGQKNWKFMDYTTVGELVNAVSKCKFMVFSQWYSYRLLKKLGADTYHSLLIKPFTKRLKDTVILQRSIDRISILFNESIWDFTINVDSNGNYLLCHDDIKARDIREAIAMLNLEHFRCVEIRM